MNVRDWDLEEIYMVFTELKHLFSIGLKISEKRKFIDINFYFLLLRRYDITIVLYYFQDKKLVS